MNPAMLREIFLLAVPLLVAVILHEVAHGWVADRLGDPTARRMGRLTLNPLAHIDPIGTVLMPIFLMLTTGFFFGYAKPVPVNFWNLRDPKRDMVWVAAAGPATNVALAIVSGLLFRTLPNDVGGVLPVAAIVALSVQLNVLLAVFNLLPIPPADGGRILVGLLPDRQGELVSRIEPFGMFILMFLIFFDPFGIFSRGMWPLIRGVSHLALGM
ncbi:MAG: site-2 protease family protein [Candidatus Tectomicrobia bacterium]|nr:site-2 protease family protein [Candidatus Tectomicrobia bacterium]